MGEETLDIPIPSEENDEVVLRRLRMFYRMIQMESGIVGLILPKRLERIDYIELNREANVLGRRTETLQLGRSRGRLTSLFKNPELGKHTRAVAEQIHDMPKDTALDFQQSYNLHAISIVIAIPPLGSLIFLLVWIRAFLHRDNVDHQALVSTAFTGASYIVTTGALIVAFIAFLDQKRYQNKATIEKMTRTFKPPQVDSTRMSRSRSL